MSVAIHPLPLLNISDHVTRARLVEQPVVVGALLGTQVNRQVVIANSFELQVVDKVLSADFFANRKEQFKQVFPSLDVVGWYSAALDLELHTQVSTLIENPTFIHFEAVANELPLTAYETALDGTLAKVDYVVETGEAERIAVDGASKGMEEGQVGHLTTLRNAIAMLYERMAVLKEYIAQVQAGEAKADPTILRQISALTAQLPLVDAKDFERELRTEYSDVQLSVYLGSTLRQLDSLVELADKEKVPSDSKPRRR